MRRTINWADYKDNWQDFTESAAGLVLDTVIGIGIIVIAVPLALVLVILGFAPTMEEPWHG
jgi:hypothetical protein